MGFGVATLTQDIFPFHILWYVITWYGWLLIIDGLIFKNQGHSFIHGRQRELAAMLFWSVPFWFIFEGYNLVLKNWYYVYLFRTDWVQEIYAWVAFATVFPACFFHAELVKSFGWFKNKTCTPINIKKGLTIFFSFFGGLCIVMPLLFPKYCYWMVWGAPLGIPDYLCYRIGCGSLLGDFEKGKLTRFLNLIIGGFIAGFMWEALNFWAHCKWIYTVPGMTDWKIFEMPIIGFLGFPVLALGAYSTYSLFSHYLRNDRNWEVQDNPATALFSKKMIFIVPLIFILTHYIYLGLLQDRVMSRRLLESEIPKNLSKNPQELIALKKMANHKGMGYANAVYLWNKGIRSINELAGFTPEEIILKIDDAQGPSLEEIQVWIRSAKLWGRSMR